MPTFGPNSKKHLDTLHPKLQAVLNEAINHFDFSCIWGHRDQQSQDRAFQEGNSQLKWPKSRHNSLPAEAVDVIPYPGGFKNDDKAFDRMATYILGAASKVGVRVQWGGHWKHFKDLAHFELIDKEGNE